MPWSCTIGSAVHVGWYDRRAATSTANDLTAYFRGSASVQGTSLVAGAEVNVSGVSDPQCATAFPCGERDLNDPKVQQRIRETLLNRKDQLLRPAYYEVARNEAKVVNQLALKVISSNKK